ncbi:MAG TPA: hypothetical protein VE863_16070 [Pyrinomonadaceae bacterium]|nr:hypothetical protein [Pyrinomonadaceae bacterium]
MKNFFRKLFPLAITLALAVLSMAQSDKDAITLNQISGYRQWAKVNRQPVKADISVRINPADVVS